MRFLGTKKHKLKIKNSIRRANTKNLKHKGFSDEEIEKFLDEIVVYKWRIFTESSFNRYLKVIKRFCKYLAAKFQTSHLTMFEAENIYRSTLMYEKQGGYQLILSTLIFLHFVKFSEEGQLNLDTLHATELI